MKLPLLRFINKKLNSVKKPAERDHYYEGQRDAYAQIMTFVRGYGKKINNPRDGKGFAEYVEKRYKIKEGGK